MPTTRGAAMAEREVDMQLVFERTGGACLAQAYRILVPERRGRAGYPSGRLRRGEAPDPPRPAGVETDEGAHLVVVEHVRTGT